MRRIEPLPGQESVWDYPRPPRVEPSTEHVVVRFGGQVVAETTSSLRVLETSHPPVYYLPRTAFADGVLEPAPGRSFCEFKGVARYLTIRAAGVSASSVVAEAAAWFYPSPSAGYESLRDAVAIYPGRMEQCSIDGEVVTAQDGDFYGGWITSRVVGPFKGAPGTLGW